FLCGNPRVLELCFWVPSLSEDNPGLARIHVLVFIWEDECSLSERLARPMSSIFQTFCFGSPEFAGAR
ncbi:hypothetical protein A2U01_0070930, partial [Trifolium medium]|nr:hypothetical protein [Trifolium medium]